MDHITLPSVAGQVTLERALDILQQSGKSALVADLPSRPAVIDIEDILSTWRKKGGNTLLAEVVPRTTSVRLPTQEPAGGVLRRQAMRQTTESLIDSERAGYAVTLVREGEGEVITRNDRGAEFLRKPTRVFRCRANLDHIWLASDLLDGKCPLDSSAVDSN